MAELSKDEYEKLTGGISTHEVDSNSSNISWHYALNGNRSGPVSENEMHQLITSNKIIQTTLVWKEGMPAWIQLQETNLAPLKDPSTPPALPPSEINNTFAWIIAFVPLIGAAFEKIVPEITKMNLAVIFLGYSAAYSILSLIDFKKIRGAGRADATSPLSYFWLPPVYLYKRARFLNQPMYYPWAWITAFIAAVFIAQPNILSKDTYWGLGVPPCDSSFSKQQVSSIFGNIPLVKLAGAVAVRVEGMREISNSKSTRDCTATVITSNGASLNITYKITMISDNNIYYNVNLLE